MPVWAALLGTLGWNVHRHLRGKSTLCSTARRYVPAAAMTGAWFGLSAWLLPHYRRGFRQIVNQLDPTQGEPHGRSDHH